MKRTKVFEVEYKYFEPGTMVKPTSNRCSLSEGIYEIISCTEPLYASDEAICFVKGHKYGISTEYLEEVK